MIHLGNINWGVILHCLAPELALLAFKHTLVSLSIDIFRPSQ